MKDWIEEFLTVFAKSGKMQLAFWLGIIAFFMTHVVGWYMLESGSAQIQDEYLNDVFINKIARKYDKAALVFLVISWVKMFRLFKQEQLRIYR
ncbi:hypothetical protein ND925_18100 [Vibrio diabolicus]|uniref:hypothetical protein n=1 Tax=Vibrio diabolicus TaxID=50719 RepID=UPI00215E60F8|nr:hypothetical protein [Vibrio diabolicus]MCS0384668.1 hypothetical protein [Vibrio diabolicus]